MKPVVLISAVCVLVASAAIGTAAGSTKPLPAPRVDVSGWSAKKTYTIGPGGEIDATRPIKIAGAKYQEPVPTGTGSCASGTTSGLALATWNDKSTTVISYQTQSVTGGVFLGGSQSTNFSAQVVPSMKLKRVGGTGSKTIKTTRYSGAGSLGALTFSPNPDPTACNTGVKSAGINGFVGIGSSS